MKPTQKPTPNRRNVPVGRWSICLLLALAVASCTRHDEPTEDPAATVAPLQVGSATMNGGLSTYADQADRTLNAPTDQMGIYLQMQPGVYRAVNNQQFAYATPYWLTDEQLLLTGTTATLAAYYPYTAVHGQNPILMRSGVYAAADDLSYSPFIASSADSYATPTLNHAYARLQFNFSSHAEYIGTGAITRMSVSGQGIRSVAQLNLFKAAGTAGNIGDVPGVQSSVDTPLSGIAFAGNPKRAQVDFLFIPGALSGTIAFSATIDGRVMRGIVAATALCGAGSELLCGRVYQLNVRVLPLNELVIDRVTITDWVTTPVNPGGGYVPTPGPDPL